MRGPLVHRTLRPAAALVALITLALAGCPSNGAAQSAPPVPTATPVAAPLPTPAATPAVTPAPEPTAAPTPRRRGHSDEPVDLPTSAPTSPAFATLDGTWEVQLQFIDHTEYSHFALKQNGQSITGSWNVEKASYPLEGTYDGRTFKFSVKQPAETLALSGYVETASDMVGIIMHEKGPNGVFTASHRIPQKPLFGRRPPN